MRKIIVHLVYPTVTKPIEQSWKKWGSFVLGSGLAISETLPFIDNEYNGLIHALKRAAEEFEKKL
jgi:hypothetical protein